MDYWLKKYTNIGDLLKEVAGKLTDEDIVWLSNACAWPSKGLLIRSNKVKISKNVEYLFTEDEHDYVRCGMALRKKWIPTEEQLKAGLSDKSESVRDIYKMRLEKDWQNILLKKQIKTKHKKVIRNAL